jgi:hypothetical protein
MSSSHYGANNERAALAVEELLERAGLAVTPGEPQHLIESTPRSVN